MLYSDYYLWLLSLVDDGDHQTLLRYLYEHPYTWQFTLDENRAAGGINMRNRYANENGIDPQDVGTGPCSILEMLIALAERMVELLTIDIYTWFWQLIKNLGLDKFDDGRFDERGVSYILSVWLNRAYDSAGTGSLFPLKAYSGDCRNLDTWGQMNAWIAENYPHSDNWLFD